jgi:hypothetical protein
MRPVLIPTPGAARTTHMKFKKSFKLARAAAALRVTLMLTHSTDDAAGQTPPGAPRAGR